MTYKNCKTILFSTKKSCEIDEQINSFISKENVEIIDIKFSTLLDTTHDIIMSFALVLYKEK